MGLGWILLITLGALLLIMVLSSFYFSYLMQRLLYDKIEDVEYVRAYSLPPDRWQRGFLRKARRAGHIDPVKQAKQTRRNVKKLGKLIRFAETTRFMEDEQVRDEVVKVLKLVRREWEDTLE